ncbi:MAG: type III-B CRISPR module RAMP protein Cmr4 [Aquificae bacterium]|nr:type III-B CRISPR module RAMP protein Cmr4 [Aquificota bacterium]
MDVKTNLDKVLFIKAITPVHAGAGQGIDHIDLPIQREQPTRFPIIYASGVKGAFRQKALELAYEELSQLNYDECKSFSLSQLDEAVERAKPCEKNTETPRVENGREVIEEDKCKKHEEVKAIINTLAKIFGSQDCKGSITFSDAKILFFPVRSLRGVFAYATCPMLLKRYAEDTQNEELLEYLEENKDNLTPSDGEVIAPDNLVVENENGDKIVVLEEFELRKMDLPDGLIKKLHLPEELEKQISERVAIVSDDLFRYFVENFTEVVTRIKVDPETGTVKSGALWTEEYLPAESVLYSLLFNTKEVETDDYLTTEAVITLGGNQTVGKGIVKVFSREV